MTRLKLQFFEWLPLKMADKTISTTFCRFEPKELFQKKTDLFQSFEIFLFTFFTFLSSTEKDWSQLRWWSHNSGLQKGSQMAKLIEFRSSSKYFDTFPNSIMLVISFNGRIKNLRLIRVLMCKWIWKASAWTLWSGGHYQLKSLHQLLVLMQHHCPFWDVTTQQRSCLMCLWGKALHWNPVFPITSGSFFSWIV